MTTAKIAFGKFNILVPPHYIFNITQLNQNEACSQLMGKRLKMGGFVRCKHNQTDGCVGRKYQDFCKRNHWTPPGGSDI